MDPLSKIFLQIKRNKRDNYQKGAFVLVIIIALIASFSETSNIKSATSPLLLSQETPSDTYVSSASLDEETILPILDKNESTEADFKIASNQEALPLDKEQSAIIIPELSFDKEAPQTRSTIQTYVVEQGDTISGIADKFNLNWSTILWENNLTYWSILHPGDELKILPVNGLTHKVKKGENISSIASKYKVSEEKIIEFNFDDSEDASNLQVGETLIIPDGAPLPAPAPAKPKSTATKPQYVSENYTNYQNWRNNTQCHKFAYGNCTDWVAFKWATLQGLCVPSWGNAKTWWTNAQNAGYRTGYTAEKGAIIVMTCSSWLCQRYGHVAYVEDFDNDTVTFSELNAIGSQQYSKRTLQRTLDWQNGWKIIGYIYFK